MLLASVLITIAPRLRFMLEFCRKSFGMELGALAGSAVIFFLPLCLLGTVAPLAVQLLSKEHESAGSATGTVLAVSTVGGVAGTLFSGLWLVPCFGLTLSSGLVAATVATAGALGIIVGTGPGRVAMLALPVVLAALPARSSREGARFVAPDGSPVVVELLRDSRHGRIAVLRKGHWRLLTVDGILQTGAPVDWRGIGKGRFLSDRYHLELIPYMVDDPSAANALVIGLAGGLAASLLAEYGVEVDCVELDPTVARVARECFGFRGNVTIADGRRYLAECSRRYDFCVVDVYCGDVLPFHMVSLEAFRAVKRVLEPEGTLALNFVGRPDGLALASVTRTVGRVFAHVLAVKSEAGTDVQPVTLFAADKPIEFHDRWVRHTGPVPGVDPVRDGIDRLTVRSPHTDGVVLTDDHNPIDVMHAAEAIRWRERTLERFGSLPLL